MKGMRNFIAISNILLFLPIIAYAQNDEAPPLYKNPAAPIENRIKDLLGRMTTEEKIEQLSGGQLSIGGLTGLATLNAGFDTPDNERLGIPGLKFTDGPRGVRFGKSTCFAVSASRAASWDRKLEKNVGNAMGLETLAKARNCLLAPSINVVRHPGYGRAQETYGEDPFLLGEMGVAFINGAQKSVMADAKHYAANNIENTRQIVNVVIDERTLREVYLPHFKKAVQDAKVASVMSAYNRVNGLYCSENERLLKDILKDEWGFDGFVVSDWFAFKIRPLRALEAGLDVEMPFALSYGLPLRIAEAIHRIPMESLDESVKRILRQKFRFGLFDIKRKVDADIHKSEEHKKQAYLSSLEGITLLKNDNNVLPLNMNTMKTIAVVGKYANTARLGDSGSSAVTPEYTVSPYEGIKNRAGKGVQVLLSEGDDAAAVASKADVTVVVAALTPQDEGEFLFISGGDRANLRLHEEDEQLIEAACKSSKKCVVVMEAGSAIIVEPWIDKADGIVMAWYPGQEGGNAIADVLFGNYNPSGKLPVTFGKSEDQYPPQLRNSLRATYGYYHGYRYIDKNNLEPRYEFGYGLSYTTFDYSNMRIDKLSAAKNDIINVSLDLTNSGEVDGSEVVQLYVGFESSKIDRSAKELKGFEKVAVAPGETKMVTIPIKVEDLAYYNVDKKDWEVENITYSVYIGASSKDIRLKGEFSVN